VSHRSRAPITRMKAGPLRATVVMMLCMMMKLPLRQALRTSATTTAPRMMVNSYSDERRLIRGVLAEAVEAQGRIRDALEQQLLKKQPALVSTASDDDEKAARAREKALRRAEMVPIRLAEVGEREEALAELQIRLGEATDSAGIDGLKRDMQEIGLGNLLESFDVDAPARGIWGRPDDFEGLVVSSPKHGIPILISRQRHSDSVLRRVSRGTDLWFQAREGRGSRVLLRTSMRRNLSKSPRECMEVAAAYAAFFSDSGSQRRRSHRGRGGDESSGVDVMWTDSRHVAKRGGRVGQLKDAKKLGIIQADPWTVAQDARDAQEEQGWI
jgi:hypothetical protein